jgi:hypothetical protein
VGLDARILLQEGFDLIQGRKAGRSGRTVFVHEPDLDPEYVVYVLLCQDPSHAPSARRAVGLSAWRMAACRRYRPMWRARFSTEPTPKR